MPQTPAPPSFTSVLEDPTIQLGEYDIQLPGIDGIPINTFFDLPSTVPLQYSDYDAGSLQFTTIINVSINGYQTRSQYGAVVESPFRSSYGVINIMRGEYVVSRHELLHDATQIRRDSAIYKLSKQSSARPKSLALGSKPELIMGNSSQVRARGERNPGLIPFLASFNGVLGGTAAGAIVGESSAVIPTEIVPYDEYRISLSAIRTEVINALLEMNEVRLDGDPPLGDMSIDFEPLRLGVFIKEGLDMVLQVRYVKTGIFEEHELLPIYDPALGGGSYNR